MLTLKKTIPSGSHNAPRSEELGSHWPEGQKFKLVPKSRMPWRAIPKTSVLVEQIGGEEVMVRIPRDRFEELFGVKPPKEL